MELYAYAVNSNDNSPVAFATVQRRWPNGPDSTGHNYHGEDYSSPIVADAQGYFNGRVPDNTFTWYITSASYNPQVVDLTNAVDQGTAYVKMVSNGDLPAVTVTPGSSDNKTRNALIAVAAAAAAAYYAHTKHWI